MWPKLPEAKKPVSEKRTYQDLAQMAKTIAVRAPLIETAYPSGL
jgi:hypothetical protein